MSTCVPNNGFTTDIFFVKRGVRQGDPLSASLFILALETLLCQIQKAFLINGKEIKTTLFADDMTCFLRDKNSYFQLQTSLQNFARYSGLRVNDEKTEIFVIGPHSLVQDVLTYKIRNMIKMLGVYFNYGTQTRLKANCESIFKSIQGTLNSWKGRGLTLIGKIQIAKCFLCFIVPKFLSKATLISVPEDQVKEINKLIYHFIWKGNDIKSNDLR